MTIHLALLTKEPSRELQECQSSQCVLGLVQWPERKHRNRILRKQLWKSAELVNENQISVSLGNSHSKLLVRRSHGTQKQKSPVCYEIKRTFQFASV